MSEPLIWPPPPNTSDPLTEHDTFLTACVRNSTPKPPLSRLSLVKSLRQETSRDLRYCLSIVNSYCDRNAILMPTRSPFVWIGFVAMLFLLTAIVALQVSWFFFERAHNLASTLTAKRIISAERVQLDLVFLVIIAICVCSLLMFIWFGAKNIHRDGEEARAKFVQ